MGFIKAHNVAESGHHEQMHALLTLAKAVRCSAHSREETSEIDESIHIYIYIEMEPRERDLERLIPMHKAGASPRDVVLSVPPSPLASPIHVAGKEVSHRNNDYRGFIYLIR